MMMDCAPVRLRFRPNCSDGDIRQGSDGTQKSKVRVHSQYGLGRVVRPPGFEPGSEAWKASILDQARLWPRVLEHERICLRFKSIDKVNHTRQVSGRLIS